MNDEKSFILIEFDQLGSTNYSINFQSITAAQLFIVANVLQIEAEQGYNREKAEAFKAQLAKPTEGILRP